MTSIPGFVSDRRHISDRRGDCTYTERQSEQMFRFAEVGGSNTINLEHTSWMFLVIRRS